MADEKRPYTKRARAESEAETRKRITESAVELHGTLGPARTSMSAIADHAGVRRSTLYRHFPDEVAVFEACSAHWVAANPPPDPGALAGIEDPAARLRAALEQLYRYYRRNEQMLANLHRDEETVPAVRRTFRRGFRTYQRAVRGILMQGRRARGRRREVVQGATGHAIAFTTWRSLAREQGLSDEDAAAVASELVECAATMKA
jgi:AcrR family transcriptional regulator